METGYRILICETDARSRQTLEAGFGASPHEFVWCSSIEESLLLLDNGDIDAAVVCLSGDGSQLEVFDRIDKTGCNIPILIATPGKAIEARILGLERGAADYLIKPFDMNELVTRVSTVLRRRTALSGRITLRGGLKLDMETGYLGDGKKWITLSPKERQAFSLLLEYGDQPTPKSQLKNAIADGKSVSDNALEVVIYRLRAKAIQWGMNIRVYRSSGYVLEYS
ncbi:MAG: response regulator transcription factor [Sideroxydans sp.]|nr:response regulator transcription factor [Sideroxydans sp.]